MLRFSACLALLLSTTWSRAEEPAKKLDVDTHIDIAYRTDKDADPIKHKLDIYTPPGKKDFPVLFFVHGGSWKTGNKSMYVSLGATFARQGIGTVIINYRLTSATNNVKHPDHIKDVAAAFAWVHENIKKYGGRNDRIFVSGHSAGGHLVSLLATDESYLKAHKLGLKDIRGVVSLSGVYQIIPNIRIFDDQFGKDPDICLAASPLSHVKGNHPPFLICYADKDIPTIDRMSETFCKKLGEGKCEAKILKATDRTHISIIMQLALNSDDVCTAAMFEFIEKNSEWKRAKK
ncbi:MAG: alpha/beta hydrolase [Planctomycetes bacterium]|nr:alpha/beta hydrolase [Planctomycetota bacterium]